MLQNDKAAFRAHMKQERDRLPAEQRAAQGRAISERVLAESVYQNAKTVFCYCSSGSEIDTYGILNDALKQGKRLCLPRTVGRGLMEACRVDDLKQLHAGKYGILEPDESCEIVAPDALDLCIVPCLAADLSGYRLGYGGGYYDRYLPRTEAVRMLLCAQSRIFPHIPVQEHDISCDILITESQVIRPHEK